MAAIVRTRDLRENRDTEHRQPSMDQHIGARLRLRRMMLKMSQRELGRTIGVSFQQIQKYENGSNRISAADLPQLAVTLAVPVTYFFEDAPDCQRNPDRSPSEDVQSMIETMRNRDSVELIKAFMKVGNVDVRQGILALVRSIASQT